MTNIKVAALLSVIALLTACASVERTPSSQRIVELERFFDDWRGTPYRYGGESRRGMDCSAFVSRAYQDVYGHALPRTTRHQARTGSHVATRKLQPGDLVFFRTGRDSRHVGIYVEKGEFIHASQSKGVTRSSLNNSYWKRHYWRARRIPEATGR
ncbi:MAG: NlpC/P60 family protein [Pseudomonadota bacterium]|nr:NlpC/P60 family protein [Pseudomonadota bacterium]